jgi:hypothetical protein
MNEETRKYVKERLKEADLLVQKRLSDPQKQAEFERMMGLVQSRTAAYVCEIEQGMIRTISEYRNQMYN